MRVDPASTRWRTSHEGRTYFFCNERCLATFQADPSGILEKAADAARRASAGASEAPSYAMHPEEAADAAARPTSAVVSEAPSYPMHSEATDAAARRTPAPSNGSEAPSYTCPMHPEVRSGQPGACPACGMGLEPRRLGAGETSDAERTEMTRRLGWSIAPALAVLLLTMADRTPDALRGVLSPRTRQWLELAAATPVVLWGARPILARGLASLRNRSLNMFTLVALGTCAAYAYSVIATVLPGLFPAAYLSPDGTIGSYFEAAAAIVVLVLAGQVLELRARARTSDAIRSLLRLAPPSARRVRPDGADEDVPVDRIHPGDRLRIRPGERLPCDGAVIEGASAVDESMLTGESMPVEKGPGSPVAGGTLNTAGAFVMRAERVGGDTQLARIARWVQDAQRTRAPVQRLADLVSGRFVLAVVAAALATFAVWAAIGPGPCLAHALVNAVAVLVVACPCALGLATPMSVTVGIGRAAAAGILYKNARALEMLRTIDTLVVDKTGTLTEGKPRVVSVDLAPGFDEAHVLRLAASLERGSEHPFASAVVERASLSGVRLTAADRFRARPGLGISGRVDGHDIAAGSAALAAEMGADVRAWRELAEARRAEGRTAVFVVVDRTAAALLGIVDPIKDGAFEAMRALRADGLRLVMLTGDAETTARAVAREIGVDDVQAEVSPVQKGEVVRRYARDRIVGMAGDGINDAPALAAAHVGIAVGGATDVALEAADVVLLGRDLGGIVRARALSRAAMRNVRQNLALAFVYNLAAIPLAAGVLFPFTGWLLSPTIAGAAMTLSSVSVIANALRLNRVRLP